MAPRIKSEKTPTQEARIISKPAFEKVLRKLKAEETVIKQSRGTMTSAVQKAVSDYNLHADALRVFRKYAKKKPTQAAEFYLQLGIYWEYGGLGQPNDDLVETPAQRKARHNRMTKPQIEAEERELGRGTHKIENGRMVPLPEAAE